MAKNNYALSDADLSEDLKYRFSLLRVFNNPPKSLLGFSGLNPSTADWKKDDQTIRTEAGWTSSLGYDGFLKVNLWPFRATLPRDLHHWILWQQPSFTHPNIEKFTVHYAVQQLVSLGCKMVICCWGTNANKKFAQIIKERGDRFTQTALDAGLNLKCIEVTKDGYPAHPLYKKITGNIHPWGLKSQGFTNASF